MWTQIVGKVRLAKAPLLNHWWQVPLYVTSRGLGTSAIPDGARLFEIDFDFLAHRLAVTVSDGQEHAFRLEPMSVAEFYRRTMLALEEVGVDVHIVATPAEVPDPIPFARDEAHASYDAAAVERFSRALQQANRVLSEFRAGFMGKASPVHFFWGSFDLAVTRFSGRLAPPHPGVPGVPDVITREAYSHEVSSAGFWPGGNGMDAAFYAYAYPEPAAFGAARVRPETAFYSDAMREFFLPYEAAATLANWDRASLERRGA